MSEYYSPEHESEKFNCPHCKIYAHQRWSTMYIEGNYGHEVYHSMCQSLKLTIHFVIIFRNRFQFLHMPLRNQRKSIGIFPRDTYITVVLKIRY